MAAFAVVAVAALLAGCTAGEDTNDSFDEGRAIQKPHELAPLHAAFDVRYSGLNEMRFVSGEPVVTVGGDLRPVAAAPIDVHVQGERVATVFWSASSRVASDHFAARCAGTSLGEPCAPWSVHYWGDSCALFWGGTLLAEPGLAAAVEAPSASSPPGTSYVALVRHDPGNASTSGCLTREARLHMDGETVFPLLAEVGSRTFRREALTVGAPWRFPDVAPGMGALPRAPSKDGLPPQGAPAESYPALEEARRETGASPTAPAHALVFERERGWTEGGVLDGSKWWRDTFEHVGTDGATNRYERRREWVRDQELPLAKWSVTSVPGGGGDRAPACDGEAAAVWDVARRAVDLGMLHAVGRYDLEPGCRIRLEDLPTPQPPQEGRVTRTVASVVVDLGGPHLRHGILPDEPPP